MAPDISLKACFHCAVQILEIYGMSEISGPQTGNSYDKVWYKVMMKVIMMMTRYGNMMTNDSDRL